MTKEKRAEYDKRNFESIQIRVRKGERARYREIAERLGYQTTSGMFRALVAERLTRGGLVE